MVRAGESLRGLPERSVERIDPGGLERGLRQKICQRTAHAVADWGEVGDHAAGIGDLDRKAGGLVEAVPGGADLEGEIVAGLLERVEGDGVAGPRGASDDGNEGGKIRVRKLIDERNEVVKRGKGPVLLNGFEQAGGLFAVERVEGEADGVDADPVAGALVSNGRTVAAGVGGAAGVVARDNVGPGPCDGKDAGAAAKGGVKGDLVVSGEDESALGDEVSQRPGGPLADDGDGNACKADAGGVDV